jgi:hypothetical protein
MRVKVPTSLNEILLGDVQRWQSYLKMKSDPESFDDHRSIVEKVSIFTSLKKDEVELLERKDLNRLNDMINEALNKQGEFKPRFVLDGVEYGFHPNLDKMTGGEYTNLRDYSFEPDTLHRTAAILFRPIVSELFDTYQIAKYNGTDEHCEKMKMIPASIMNGAIVFFSNLTNELNNYIRKYLQAVQAKEKSRNHFG